MPEISDEEKKSDRSEEVLGRRDFMPLQVRTVRTWNGLESIRSAWERILHGAEALTIFSTLEWLGAWWKAFAKDKELVAPVFSNSEGEIVALFRSMQTWSKLRFPFERDDCDSSGMGRKTQTIST